MKIKVMSFNLRVDGGEDGINNFSNRGEKIIRMIRSETPDLIGFQEATDRIKLFLREQLSDMYVILGAGRNRHYRGESVCLAYRWDLFELVSFETFWLSSEPAVPGSRYVGSDQSPFPRIAIHAELSPQGMDQTVHFFNTHLDHMGEQARMLGMTQIVQREAFCRGGVILTGDMNAAPGSPEMSIATALASRTFRDATSGISQTFHNFGKLSGAYKIDYIFTDGKASGAYAVSDNPEDGIYLSDHYPVCTEIEFE